MSSSQHPEYKKDPLDKLNKTLSGIPWGQRQENKQKHGHLPKIYMNCEVSRTAYCEYMRNVGHSTLIHLSPKHVDHDFTKLLQNVTLVRQLQVLGSSPNYHVQFRFCTFVLRRCFRWRSCELITKTKHVGKKKNKAMLIRTCLRQDMIKYIMIKFSSIL